MKFDRYIPLLASLLTLLAACTSSETPDANPTTPTAIDSFGANPNPVPANIPVIFSWSVTGDGLTCAVDVDNNGANEYTVQDCSSSSRIGHVYGTQGSFTAQLTMTGADGKTVQSTSPVNVLAPNSPPSIPSLIPTASPSATNPLAVRFTWVVTDMDADITHCRFDANSDGVWDFDNLCSGLPATSSVGKASRVTYTYTHTYPAGGHYTATLEAADPYTATLVTIPLRAPWNRHPIIISLETMPGDNNTSTVSFTVSDPDDDPLSCKLTVQSIGTFFYKNCSLIERTYIFREAGIFGVTLEVTDEYGGFASKTAQIVFTGEPEPPAPAVAIISLSTNISLLHACALDIDYKAYCWGRNHEGQLGNDTETDSKSPVAVSMPSGVTFNQITAGWTHTCALGSDNVAYCWGENYGQLGNGTYTDSAVPVAVSMPAGVTFSQISAGASHTCALGSDNVAYCWGGNWDSQLGNGTTTTSNSPVAVSMPASVTFSQISAGISGTCALGSDNQTYCWGSGDDGALGNGTTDTESTSPEAVTLPTGVTFDQISASGDNSFVCALGNDDNGYCWGKNGEGGLGNNTTTGSNLPVAVSMPASVSFIQISAGGDHTCALDSSNNAYCWGSGWDGEMGNGTTTGRNLVPVSVSMPSGVTFSQIRNGRGFSCALGNNQKVYCWGNNTYGQLGIGNTNLRNTPAALSFP